MIVFGERRKIHLGHLARVEIPPGNGHRPLAQGLVPVRHHQFFVQFHAEAQPRTVRAGAEGIVEGKEPRLDLLNADIAHGAGVFCGIELLFPLAGYDDQSFRQLERRFQAVRQPLFDSALDDEAVHDHGDIVLDVFIQLNLFVQRVNDAVHFRAGVACLAVAFQLFGIFALSAPHDGRVDQNLAPLGHRHHLVRDLIYRLPFDPAAAFRAVRFAHAREQKTEIIVNFRHRAHRGAGIIGCGLLVDGNGGRQTLDGLDVRLFHLSQKHARVARQALHIAPLPFREDRLERERGLSAPRDPGEHHQLFAGDRKIDIFQIIFLRTFDSDIFLHLTFSSSISVLPACP